MARKHGASSQKAATPAPSDGSLGGESVPKDTRATVGMKNTHGEHLLVFICCPSSGPTPKVTKGLNRFGASCHVLEVSVVETDFSRVLWDYLVLKKPQKTFFLN